MAIITKTDRIRIYRAQYHSDMILLDLVKARFSLKIDRTEQKIADELFAIWQDNSRASINKNVGEMRKRGYSDAAIEEFLDELQKDSGELASGEKDEVFGLLMFSYEEKKKREAKKLKTDPSISAEEASRVEAVHNDQMYWFENNFRRNLRQRVKAAIKKAIKDTEDKSEAETLKAVKDAVSREMSVIPGGTTTEDSGVASPFAGRQKEWMQSNANTAVGRSLAFSSLQVFEDAELNEYRIDANAGRNSSEMCKYMNGRLFTLKQGQDLMDHIVGIKDYEELLTDVPFWSVAAVIAATGIYQGEGLSSKDAAAALSKLGLALPPYHHECGTGIRKSG